MSQILSPALVKGEGQAYELKFSVSAPVADSVLAWASHSMTPDVHGRPELGGAYVIHTLYLDTPTLQVLRQERGFRSRKHRIRRYGDGDLLFLERKTKRGEKVSKFRTPVPGTDLNQLSTPMMLENWQGRWFREELEEKSLRPSAAVSYRRMAFTGDGLSPIRLTIDDQLNGARWTDWSVPEEVGNSPLMTDQRILELKFQDIMPPEFRELIGLHRLVPAKLSKYRLSCTKAGEERRCQTG